MVLLKLVICFGVASTGSKSGFSQAAKHIEQYFRRQSCTSPLNRLMLSSSGLPVVAATKGIHCEIPKRHKTDVLSHILSRCWRPSYQASFRRGLKLSSHQAPWRSCSRAKRCERQGWYRTVLSKGDRRRGSVQRAVPTPGVLWRTVLYLYLHLELRRCQARPLLTSTSNCYLGIRYRNEPSGCSYLCAVRSYSVRGRCLEMKINSEVSFK